ncbi:hypothetical protein [Streptomyces melanogenes]|uniref:hypothetical protein n=1 Tax=Streptomyces melanogenes TaxID=67326 RepID=UPI00167C75CA|nr:hypothetical protein GCM10010278_81970 [Streptomyces melanogenes]
MAAFRSLAINQNALLVALVGGIGEEETGGLARGEGGVVGLDAALVDVAKQQVRACGAARLPDLVQEVGDGDGRIHRPP